MLRNFEEKNPEYKSRGCCGIHVQRAALAVGVAEAMRTMVLTVMSFSALTMGTCDDRNYVMCVFMSDTVLYGTILCCLFGVYTIISLTLLFLGLDAQSPGLLVPHIVAQSLWMMYMSILAGCYLIWGRGNGILYLLCVLYVINFGFEVWFVRIVVRCWQFFRLKRQYLKTLFFTELDHPLYRTTKDIVLSPGFPDSQSTYSYNQNGVPPLSLNLKTVNEFEEKFSC